MKKYIGIDIGGTFIKYGIINENGQVMYVSKMPTEAHLGGCGIEQKVLKITKMLLDLEPNAYGIGISTAGVVDDKTGIVVYSNDNIPNYTNTNWKKIIAKHFKLEVAVENDVFAASIAEAWIGAGKGLENFLCITLGTGIGGALFMGGRLYKGAHSRAGAIGYMLMDETLEYFEKRASAFSLIQKIKDELDVSEITGKEVFLKSRSNENGYNLVLNEWLKELSKGIANMIYMFDPGIIIIGGGLSAEKSFLIDEIINHLHKLMLPTFLNGTLLKVAECGNRAGMIGAVYPIVQKV